MPIITHQAEWPEYQTEPHLVEMCHDPYPHTDGSPPSAELELCHEVLKRHTMDLAAWAVENLSQEARRRIILAHFGFFQFDVEALATWLDAGLSIDLSANLSAFSHTFNSCVWRKLFAQYPTQVIFGTDSYTLHSCTANRLGVYGQGLFGELGQVGSRPVCGSSEQDKEWYMGLDLDVPEIEGCPTVHDEIDHLVLVDNLLSMYRELRP